MTKDEALKLALDALEDIGDEWGFTSQRTVPKRKEAITAIKEALANEALEKMAENARELGLNYEPVAYVKTVIEALYENSDPVSVEAAELLERITTPPQRKPLTDEEILADETLRYYFGLNGGAGPVSKQGRKIVNAIEALHNIKETEK